MAQVGSLASALSNTFCEARYQKECWYSMARSKSAWAAALHEVSKWTLPSLSSEAWAKTTDPSAANPRARPANAPIQDILIIASLPEFAKIELGIGSISA